MAKISLVGYYNGAKGQRLLRLPQEPSKNEREFWLENGGVDEFRQIGWISMNTTKVWGLDDPVPKDIPDLTPLCINVRGD